MPTEMPSTIHRGAKALVVCLRCLRRFRWPAARRARPRRPTPAQIAPPEVGIVTVEQSARPHVRELPGRIAPTRIAEVRARVPGIVIARTFEQGSEVRAGDVLYQLDPAPYEVELSAARPRLHKAQAVRRAGRAATPQRIETLVRLGRLPGAVRNRAIATLQQAHADVAARRADVARAKLNLDLHRRSRRRSAAASAARWSPKARWSARARRRTWRPSSISTRSMPTSRSRSAK